VSYNAADLVRYLPIALASICHILLGFILGAGTGWVLGLKSPDINFLVLMTSFNNNSGLPFILLVPLCQTWAPAVNEGPLALGRAYAMVAIYTIPWTILMFTLAIWVIQDAGRAVDSREQRKIIRSSTRPVADGGSGYLEGGGTLQEVVVVVSPEESEMRLGALERCGRTESAINLIHPQDEILKYSLSEFVVSCHSLVHNIALSFGKKSAEFLTRQPNIAVVRNTEVALLCILPVLNC
jgi:hypothetical protein